LEPITDFTGFGGIGGVTPKDSFLLKGFSDGTFESDKATYFSV
jgi:hypothetical protein